MRLTPQDIDRLTNKALDEQPTIDMLFVGVLATTPTAKYPIHKRDEYSDRQLVPRPGKRRGLSGDQIVGM